MRAWLVCIVWAAAAARAFSQPAMIAIPAGSYLPLYAGPSTSGTRDAAAGAPRPRRNVAAFDMDARAVTNAEYLAFVAAHPEWRRSAVKPVLADAAYLHHWRGDLDPGPDAPLTSPVVFVSWFAARAYLHALGKELPTVDQWEYVAAASDTSRDASRAPAFLDRLQAWYGRPAPWPLPPAEAGFRNVYGVVGLHGSIWEWTLDFNSAMVTGDARTDAAGDANLFCGGGAAGAAQFDNYPAFMRYAFRSSLQGRYAIATLGFRGVAAHQERSR